jgi:hypothetical protein
MLNVFSDSKLKMSEQIRELQKCAGSNYERLLFAGPKDEPLYILKPKAADLLRWVNENILFKLPEVKTKINVQWVGVRIRIATNMLNKLESEGILTKEVCIMYHKRFISRIRKIVGEIYVEDLPF